MLARPINPLQAFHHMKKNTVTIVEKQALPVILDQNTGEPIALIFFSKDRKRIIYTLSEAGEEDIMQLLTPQLESSGNIATEKTLK